MSQQSVSSDVDTLVQQDSPYFFTPSHRKMVLMSIVTLSFYTLVWFYANWRLVRDRRGSNIMPLWRTLFGIFFAYAMFKEIDGAAAATGTRRLLYPAGLALFYVACILAANLPGQWTLLCFLIILPPIIANKSALAVNAVKAPGYVHHFSVPDWVWALIGLIGLT